MKKAYLISTGTELLTTSTTDTNGVFLAQQLEDMGIRVIGISIVGDSEQHLTAAFEQGIKQADIVISSGGLGPTRDDLTKEVACQVMQAQPFINEAEAQKLRDFFARSKRSMPESNLKQAMFPESAIILNNRQGTAPGMYLNQDEKIIICLPGPPTEMQPMFLEEVKPLLLKEFSDLSIRSVRRSIKVFGSGESQVEAMISQVLDNTRGCSLAMLARQGEIEIKLTAEGRDLVHSQVIMTELIEKLKPLLGPIVYGYDDDTLLLVVTRLLAQQGKTVALAESCTGGLLAEMMTELPGSSQYFWGSAVTYSNEAKVKLLQIEESLIQAHGAVSEQVARAMAENIKRISGSDIGIGITGIAGPGGGSPQKPVGLVYIGLAQADGCQVKELRWVANRELTRVLAAKSALDMIRRNLVS